MSGFNMQELMSQARSSTKPCKRKWKDAGSSRPSGGGTSPLKMDGRKQVLGIKIDPEAVKAGDIEMLQDLITAAINGAGRKVMKPCNPPWRNARRHEYSGDVANFNRGVRRGRREEKFLGFSAYSAVKNKEFWNRGLLEPFAEPLARLIETKEAARVGSKSAQRLASTFCVPATRTPLRSPPPSRTSKANLRLCSICKHITDVDPCVLLQ